MPGSASTNFIEFANLPFYVVPILIFLARILDVSIGTVRIILVSRGNRTIASVLGFFEVFIWLLAISQIVQNLTDIVNYIAYAAGFAAGTYIGMTIERRLAIGNLLVRVIIPREHSDLIVYLIAQNYKITYVEAEGALGHRTIIFMIVNRSSLKKLINIIKQYSPKAFYTVEDVRMVRDPDITPVSPFSRHYFLHPFQWFRKGK
ncbi:MAG: DUF2179 domain-containing protein [Candidatus Zixiibacteriota bacterium]